MQSINKKRATLLFIGLSTAASALNYLLYPILARLLPGSEYTNITLALSLLTQISTFLSSLIAVTIGLTKTKQEHTVSKELASLQTFLLQALGLISITLLISSPVIMRLASTPTTYIVPIVIMLLMSVPITIISGYYNGKQKMVQLGIVAMVTASFQFVTGIITTLVTHNGVITMTAMGLIQIVSVLLLKHISRHEDIPNITNGIFHLTRPSAELRKLLVYTLFASLAIMLVNLLQVIDLMLVKQLNGTDSLFYTDTYVISRILFFGGMIFIWPFLGEIDLIAPHRNWRPFVKLMAILISMAAIFALLIVFYGGYIFHIAFGRVSSMSDTTLIVCLSILYKLLLLILTAICLYFIVLRSYSVVAIASISYVVISACIYLLPHQSVMQTLGMLSMGGVLAVIIATAAFFRSIFFRSYLEDPKLIKN